MRFEFATAGRIIFGQGTHEETGSLAGELGMAANTIAKNVQRLRERARELLLEEAAQTVAAAGDAEKELRELFG